MYTSPGSSLDGWLYKYMNNKHNNDILSLKYIMLIASFTQTM